MIETPRLKLVLWGDVHRTPFVRMHADPTVMADQGGAIEEVESLAKLDRYRVAWVHNGVSRWAIEDQRGRFLGYAGVMLRTDENHPLGRHFEIGWRLITDAWGQGYATEAARAALQDAVIRIGPSEILSYTSPDNVRSQAVMARLRLRRTPERDFISEYAPMGAWRGLVWIADPGFGK